MRRIAALALVSACFSKPPFFGGNDDGGPRDGSGGDDDASLIDAMIDARMTDGPTDTMGEPPGNPPPCPTITDNFDVSTQGPCTWGIRIGTSAVANNGKLELHPSTGAPSGCAYVNGMPFDRGLWAQLTPQLNTNDELHFEIFVGTTKATVSLYTPSNTNTVMKFVTRPGQTMGVPTMISPAFQWWKFQRQGTSNQLDVLRSTDGITWVVDTMDVNFGTTSLANVNFAIRGQTGNTEHLSAYVDNLNSPCTP